MVLRPTSAASKRVYALQDSHSRSNQIQIKTTDDDLESQRSSMDRRYIASGIYMTSRSYGDGLGRRGDDVESERNTSDRRYTTPDIHAKSRSYGDELDMRSSAHPGLTSLNAQTVNGNVDTLDDMEQIIMDDPGPRAPVKARREFLETQLDSLMGSTVLGNLQVLGGFENRLSGGTLPLFRTLVMCKRAHMLVQPIGNVMISSRLLQIMIVRRPANCV